MSSLCFDHLCRCLIFTTTLSTCLNGDKHILFTFTFLRQTPETFPTVSVLVTAFLTVGTMPPFCHPSPAVQVQTAQAHTGSA